MRTLNDKNGVQLEEGHVIIYPSMSTLRKGQILKICDSTVKVSIEREYRTYTGIHGNNTYSWPSRGWNIDDHNSFLYIYLMDFIIIGKNEIKDISKLKK